MLLNVFLLVAGQIVWKIGLDNLGGMKLSNIGSVIVSPYICFGLFLYALATVIWFFVLSRADLSMVYPMQSLSYVVGIVAAVLILGECVPTTRWIGALFLIIGVFLIALR